MKSKLLVAWFIAVLATCIITALNGIVAINQNAELIAVDYLKALIEENGGGR